MTSQNTYYSLCYSNVFAPGAIRSKFLWNSRRFSNFSKIQWNPINFWEIYRNHKKSLPGGNVAAAQGIICVFGCLFHPRNNSCVKLLNSLGFLKSWEIIEIQSIYWKSDTFTESTRGIPKKRGATATFQPWGRPRAKSFKILDFTYFRGETWKPINSNGFWEIAKSCSRP